MVQGQDKKLLVHSLTQEGFTDEAKVDSNDVRKLDALRALLHEMRIVAPADGSVLDVTDNVFSAIDGMVRIVNDDSELLVKGDKFREAEKHQLNVDSFLQMSDNGVIARTKPDDRFVNHLYTAPDNKEGVAVISFSPAKGKIVLSFKDGDEGKYDAEVIMKEIFGSEAGGRKGIAGTPKENKYTLADFDKVFQVVAQKLQH